MFWKYIRPETGKAEKVEYTEWRWEAVYLDGTVLKQYDDSGFYHQVREIDLSKLYMFKLVHDTMPGVQILWKPGRKLTYFYRNYLFNFGTEDETRGRIYCCEYQDGEDKVLITILPDNSVMITEDISQIKLVTE